MVMVSCRPKDSPNRGPFIRLAHFRWSGDFCHWIDMCDIMNYVEDRYNIECWCKIVGPSGFSKKDKNKEEISRFELLDL